MKDRCWEVKVKGTTGKLLGVQHWDRKGCTIRRKFKDVLEDSLKISSLRGPSRVVDSVMWKMNSSN